MGWRLPGSYFPEADVSQVAHANQHITDWRTHRRALQVENSPSAQPGQV